MSDDVTSVSIEAGQAPKPNDTKPPKPESIPEKFWDAEKGQVRTEELAKSYLELEKKSSQSKQPDTAKETEKKLEEAKKTDPGSNLGIQQEQAAKTVADAGLDMAALQTEFNDKGQLSPETYAKLEAAKIPKAIVDGYIEGQKALAIETQRKVLEDIGGKDVYVQAVEWAKANLPPEEIEAYDKSLRGKGVEEIKFQAKGLIARMRAEQKSDPEFVLGGASPQGVKPYKDINEMVADQRKPEYRKDPAFRAAVAKRIAVSQL
jgi:hypothetical protein